MLRKTSPIFTRACGCMKFQKRDSALFVNGAKATESFTYVTPHVDFSDQLQNKDTIKENLIKRKSKYELQKAANLWMVYEELKDRKDKFDKVKDEMSTKISKLIKSDPESSEVHKLKLQIGLIKDNIKKIKAPLWSAQEAAMVEALKLPNKLHVLTESESKVIYTHGKIPQTTKDHLKIATEQNLIHFRKNENYYLKHDAAIFELGAKFYFSKFLKSKNYVQFSNPDFVKSLIVEGCGEDHTKSDSTFILHHNEDTKINPDSRLHLVGGASLASFFAYHTKNVLYPKVFPLKYFTMGRQYIPSPSDEDSLFHVSQSSVVEFFGATKTENDADLFVEELIETLKEAYKNLDYHFQLSIVPADKLAMWESLRIALEMYSTSLNSYVEVAHISLSGDFISKRLLLTYVENKESKFPNIVSGTFLNVPKFLGCILEQDCNFEVSDQFKVKNWGMHLENTVKN